MKKPFRIKIREGAIIPKGYGISYRDWRDLLAVCHPYPLNLVIGFFRLWYFKIRYATFANKIHKLEEKNK